MRSFTMFPVAVVMFLSLTFLGRSNGSSINCSPGLLQEPISPSLRRLCSIFEQMVFDESAAPLQSVPYMDDLNRNPVLKKKELSHNFLRIGRNFGL